MSAVAGIVSFDGAPVAPGALERMTAAMAARGPDGIAHWRGGGVGLAHCALRVTPESLGERQPLANEDASVVLVMDGHVDDREGLRRELLAAGRVPRDESDAELVLRAYEAWGEECPGRIVGELAFLAWDGRRRTLFAARDVAGTRHFYYHFAAGRLAFASEIRALLAEGRITPRLNEARLVDFLVTEFDRDDEVGTFYEGIVRLPAGHAMRVTAEGVRAWRYWDPATLEEARFASLDECAEAFREELCRAIRCRLRSVGPVGAQMSGGLDSSSIVGLARARLRDRLAEPLRTFSLVRGDRERCPEWRAVQRMVEGGWIVPTILDPGRAAETWRAHVGAIGALDEPFAFSDGFTEALLCEAARAQGCRVLLDGTAGDLLFYSFGRSLAWDRRALARLPGVVAAAGRHRVEGRGRALAALIASPLLPPPLRAACRGLRDRFRGPPGDEQLLREPVARQFLGARRASRRREAVPGSRVGLVAHARTFTSGLLSFAHEVNGPVALARGIEPRSPFSDRRMIEFAVRMPVRAKLFDGWYKPLLRRAMAGVLPGEVLWRTDIGSHPGGEFRARLVAQIAAGAPEIWLRPNVERRLDRWIDGARLADAWGRYERRGDLETGLNLLSLAVLARWLGERFPAAGSAAT